MTQRVVRLHAETGAGDLVTVSTVEDKLVDSIYATVFGEGTWQDFLAKLSRILPDGRSTLFYHDSRRSKGAFNLNSGFDAAEVAKYGEYYSSINPWMPAAAVRKVGLGVVAEQMFPRDRLVKTEFYNDFWSKVGGESAVGVTIVREEGRSFLLSTLTSCPDPEANRHAADTLTRLAPHLNRAFKHFRSEPGQRTIAEIGSSLFDAVDIGMVVVGDRGLVKSASSVGQNMINTGRCLRVTLLGKIKVCQERADYLLSQMLDRSYQGSRVASCMVDAFKLTFIQVAKDPLSLYFQGPTIVILMEQGNTMPRVNGDYFSKAYGLTAAETRALAGIMAGKSVDEIANAAALSRETIRSQMKSLYAKTGTKGQLELLRLAKTSLLPV
ncbi:helix-turn-helix transcriptional regulator [Allomesorhizobium camelthorni]|uniref:helix-turn-helix transcriptional regulator n=1 Tax=Allomesorhizobium camelthorni TaxID=475069 RepID=UPI0031B596D5